MQTRLGIINLAELNDVLVEQDNDLRKSCEGAALSGEPSVIEAAMLEALCAIHERLGNMMIYLMSNS